jgi:hypothetical protein
LIIDQGNTKTEGEKVKKSIISGKQNGDLQDNLSKYSNSSQVSWEKEKNGQDELYSIHRNKGKLIKPRRVGNQSMDSIHGVGVGSSNGNRVRLDPAMYFRYSLQRK